MKPGFRRIPGRGRLRLGYGQVRAGRGRLRSGGGRFRLRRDSFARRVLDYLGVTWVVAMVAGLASRPSRPGQGLSPAKAEKPKVPRMKARRRLASRIFGRPDAAPKPDRRMGVVAIVIAVAFSLLVVRLYYLQVLDVHSFSAIVESNGLRLVQVSPPRGIIYARNSAVLAGDSVAEEVTVSRSTAATDPSVLVRLSALLGVPVSQMKSRLGSVLYSPYEPVPVDQNTSAADVVYLEEHASDFPGVSVAVKTVRQYPYGSTAAHVLGYVSPISDSELKAMQKQDPGQGYSASSQVGQAGIEGQYESYLRGMPGLERLEVNAQGNVVGTSTGTSPVMGDSVVLNLDLGLQQALESDLSGEIALLRKQGYPATSGSGVVMDPQTGAVLAMTSYPTYNPSVWVGGISEAEYQAITSESNGVPLLDRAIAGTYTPGSSFKLATATAALSDNLISPGYTYYDTGSFTIPGCSAGLCVYHNAAGEALGAIQLPLAISASDDSFFYNLGYMFWVNRGTYGDSPIQNMAQQYGFGALTGIDLPGEQAGQVDSPALRQALHKADPAAYPDPGWYPGDSVEMAFGQGMTLVSPIEMADAYSTFANGGTRYAPEIAAAIVSPEGKVVTRIAPKVMGHVNLPSSIRDPMLAGFEGAVTNPLGTAYGTFLGYPYSSLPIAGKTGTASEGHNLNASWFTGFGPVNNPQYVVSVVINKAGYGANGGAPVVRQIFQYLIGHPVQGVTIPSASQMRVPGSRTAGVPIHGPVTASSTFSGAHAYRRRSAGRTSG